MDLATNCTDVVTSVTVRFVCALRVLSCFNLSVIVCSVISTVGLVKSEMTC